MMRCKMTSLWTAGAALLLLASTPVHAQQTDTTQPSSDLSQPPTRTYDALPKRSQRGYWSWGLYLTRLGVDNDNLINPVTETREVGDEAFGLGFKAEYLTPIDLSIGFQVGFIDFNDDAEFTQDVFNFYGDDIGLSDVQGLHLELDIGPQFYFGPKGALSISPRVGVMTIAGEQRDISGCSSCFEEDVDISGGISYGFDARADVGAFLLGLSARGYAQGDIDNNLSITFQSHF